jgi:hypothetical protein
MKVRQRVMGYKANEAARLLSYSGNGELISLQINSNFESITITRFLFNLTTLEPPSTM